MKVLIVNPTMYVYGGAELLICKLANYLSLQGISNALLTPSLLPEIKKDLVDTQVITCGAPGRAGGFNDLFSLRRSINKLAHEFDVINLHNFPAELAMVGIHKPCVWMCNEPAEIALNLEHEKFFLKRLLKQAIIRFDRSVVRKAVKNAVVADEYNAERFRRIYGFNPAIIHYGIEHDYFAQRPEDLRKHEGFVAVQVGMINSFKNQMESVKAAEKLRQLIPGFTLVLAGLGKGAYAESIKKHIDDHGLNNIVRITGHLDRDEIRSLYYTSDVLLHPIKAQGGWLAPFEAICAGLPIVVSKDMTASKIISDQRMGVVTDGYADSVYEIYKNPANFKAMAQRGGQWIKENLSWEMFSRQMINEFNMACERDRIKIHKEV